MTHGEINGSQLVELDGVGHVPHIEAFDKFEHALSQLHSQLSSELRRPSSPSKVKRVPQSTSLSGREKRQREIAEALRGAGSGKENRHAAEVRRERWSAPASPSKDVVLSPQSSFIVGQDDPMYPPSEAKP